MNMSAKELIKFLLTREGITQLKLTQLLTERLGKKITPDGFSRKLSRATISYDEVVKIADILGYCIRVDKKDK